VKKYLLGIVFFAFATFASAQSDTCITNLKSASINYDNGNYDQSISILYGTIRGCNLSKQDLIEANKLLLLCYLKIDNLEAANETAYAILKIDPTYTPDKFREDPSLIALFEKFKTEPSLAISLSGGANFPQIKVDKTYSVVHSDNLSGLATYQSTTGFQINGGIEKYLITGLWLEAEAQYRSSGYKHTLDSVQGSTVYYSETLHYFEIPVSLKYYFLSGPIKPFVQAGADFSFLTNALSITSRKNEQDLIDETDYRNSFDIGLSGGAGVSYNIKSFSVFADFKFVYFPNLVNKEGTRYADEINLYKYYYIDDDFRMNSIQLKVGGSFNIAYRRTKSKQ
jgi:hypothetical protein